MTNMIKAKVVQYHGRPVFLLQLVRYMACDIVVHFRKVLMAI